MKNKQHDTRNTTLGVMVSVAVHSIMLLCFLFITAWKPPNPPISEYGIELQFGLEDIGAPTPLPGSNPEQATEEVRESEPKEDLNTLPATVPALEENDDTPSEVASLTSDEKNNPIEPEKTPEKVERKKIKPKTDKSVQAPSTKDKKKVSRQTPSPPVKATYKKPEQNKSASTGSENRVPPGHKEGKFNAKALYSSQGEGVGLNLLGWTWDEIPSPYIPRNESGGRIEFEIKVDENGEIIAYRVLERSLSIAAERACKKAISQLTFTKKKGAVVPSVSVGKITFVVRAK